MKKESTTIKALLVLVTLLTVLICLLPAAYEQVYVPYSRERKSLAKELGVNINNYRARLFPFDYFEETLKPGMSSDEVHSIVRGYKTVMRCGTNAEIYYFFSTDVDKAERYLVSYDEKGKLEFTIIEADSYSLSDITCVPGRLGE